MSPEDYVELLAQRFRGRKVILATGTVAGSGSMLDDLARLGAHKPLLLAEGLGTGELPPPDRLDYMIVGRDDLPTIMEALRVYDQALNSPEVAQVADGYDPDGSALVVAALFSVNQALCGRPYYGGRRPEWCALEDKTIIDALWQELGVPHAPFEIVAADEASLRAAAARLDRGAGTVWAGDAREGWHGGAEGTRWVRDDDAARRSAAFFGPRCDRVRVMPFLEGIPCSIHGIVFPDYVVALRPVEMVTLRRPELDRFRYCGCATFWDPPAADREQMRATARLVGAALRQRVGFRGTFTIDGVMTEDGFWPTELNPRYGAGINTMARAQSTLPVYLLHLAVCEGESWDFQPRELERMLVDSGDANRAGNCHSMCDGRRSTTETIAVVEDGAVYRVATEGELADATIMIGPAILGTTLRLKLDPTRTPMGQSVASRFAMALELADRELGTSFGPSEVPRSMR